MNVYSDCVGQGGGWGPDDQGHFHGNDLLVFAYVYLYERAKETAREGGRERLRERERKWKR